VKKKTYRSTFTFKSSDMLSMRILS